MVTATIGELCAGYGGLGMGVSRVIDSRVAWVSEIDKGALKVLEHRFPGVPNIGDMTTVDWTAVTPAEAKKVCLACPVRKQCLDYALANDERFGIWGGLSERERRKLKNGQPLTKPAEPDWAEVREWARDQGIRVADVGRLSPKVVEAWRAAQVVEPACQDCGAPRERKRRFCDSCRDRRRRGSKAEHARKKAAS